MKTTPIFILIAIIITPLYGCGPKAVSEPELEPSNDSTIAGAALGAAWGAGAGAIIGNQVSYAGEGAAIGAGFGAVQGAATGMGFDATQDRLFVQEQELRRLKYEAAQNTATLTEFQSRLDTPIGASRAPAVYSIYFDSEATSPRSGSIKILEEIAASVRKDPYMREIRIEGHSDDEGTPEQTVRLAEARARSVRSYLASQGLPLDRLSVKSLGSTQPIASNETAEGRQLNRRVELTIVSR